MSILDRDRYSYSSSYSSYSSYSASALELPSGRKLYAGPCFADFPEDVTVISLNNNSRKPVRTEIRDFSVEPLESLKTAVMIAARIAEATGRVGFCCTAGCGRTGTASILYMVAYEGMTAVDAAAEFIAERNCGPERKEQWMLLALAERLRSRGLSGDELLMRLDKPRTRIELGGVVLDADAEEARVAGVSMDKDVLVMARDLVAKLAESGEEVVLPMDEEILEILREAGLEVPDEVREELETFMGLSSEAERLRDEAEKKAREKKKTERNFRWEREEKARKKKEWWEEKAEKEKRMRYWWEDDDYRRYKDWHQKGRDYWDW